MNRPYECEGVVYTMSVVIFVAKGSLFLGRISHLSDGMSFILEANDHKRR